MDGSDPRHRRGGATPGNSLAREITIVLVVKLVLLAAIWFAFFSKPPGASLGPAGGAQAVFGAAHDGSDAAVQQDGGMQ